MGFGEHQEQATYGLWYIVLIRGNSNAADLNKPPGFADDKLVVSNFECFLPHYTSSFEYPAVSTKQILSEEPT